MGTLNINLPGSNARASVSPDEITQYSVTIVDDTTGEIAVPPKVVTGGSLSLAAPVGNISVIVVAMIQREDGTYSMPYIGRTANIQVTENETVAATVAMVPIRYGIYEKTEHYPNRIQMVTKWDSGTLPALKAEGFTFDGWYSDTQKTEKITYFPDTSDYDPMDLSKFKMPFAHFTWLGDLQYVAPNNGGGNLGRKAGDSKYFYVAQNARGDGRGFDPENAMGVNRMDLNSFIQNNPGVTPEIIFIEDVVLDFNHIGDANITGKNNGVDGQRITITGTCNPVLSLAGNATDIIFDGKQSGSFEVDYEKNVTLDNCIIKNCTTGISNKGTLTLSNCTIRDCSNNYSEASPGAIDNSGWKAKLIIKNNTIIDNCSAGKGGAIMVGPDSELDVDGLTISSCSAEIGGGIFIDGSQNVTLKNCTISSCTAAQNMNIDFHNQSFDGGGIYITSGKLTVGNNCSITNCTATGNGDSIYCTIKTLIVDPKPAVVNGIEVVANNGTVTACWIDEPPADLTNIQDSEWSTN